MSTTGLGRYSSSGFSRAAGGAPDSAKVPSSTRHNPFPEVTDPFCRLPLPTLFHWPEAVHLGDLMRLCVRTEHRDQTSFCPFALREVSVLTELVLGHPRYSLMDVPPQSNSPPGCVLESDHAGNSSGVHTVYTGTGLDPPKEVSPFPARVRESAPISTLGARTTAVPRGLGPEGGALRPTE